MTVPLLTPELEVSGRLVAPLMGVALLAGMLVGWVWQSDDFRRSVVFGLGLVLGAFVGAVLFWEVAFFL